MGTDFDKIQFKIQQQQKENQWENDDRLAILFQPLKYTP